MRRVLLPIAVVIHSGCAEPVPSVERSPDHRYVLGLRPDAEQDALAILPPEGFLLGELPSVSAAVVELPDDVLEEVALHPDVDLLEPDRRRELLDALPVEGEQLTPYGISMVQAPEVWPTTRGDGMAVCIIDSGLAVGHESLQTTDLTGTPAGWDHDGCGHGTHVAGTIAALDDGAGVVGVLPDGVRMHLVKVFGDRCTWSYASDLITAIDQCRQAGAHVVNMSLGGGYSSVAERQAFDQAFEDGMLIVAAAGNTGRSSNQFPASYESVVSVAAVDSQGSRAAFSTYNPDVELAAPGVDVVSTLPGNTYGKYSGTSMASPHVAGVAALVWSADPTWTNSEIREALTATATDLGTPGRDPQTGFGLVQAKAALDWLCGEECGPEETPPEPPEVEQLVRYAFDDASRLPADVAPGIAATALDSTSGTSFFVTGTTGSALADDGWQGHFNAFVFGLTLDAGDRVRPTRLTFDERGSGTGPTGFTVTIVAGGIAYEVGTGHAVPGAWGTHTVDFVLPELTGPVEIRLVADSASADLGTWRIDEVRLEGTVVP